MSQMTPEQEAQARRLQAAVEVVSRKILADKPNATENEVGGLFDAYGSAGWKPSRPASLDFSSWGDWEAWEHQEPIPGGLRSTGDWVAWHAPSGQQIGFCDKSLLSARHQAEMMAVLQNGGRRTRVVPAGGGFGASALRIEDVQRQVEPTEKLLAARMGAPGGV